MMIQRDATALKAHLKQVICEQLELDDFSVDSDGDYRFRHANVHCLLVFQAGDPSFVKILSICHLPSGLYQADMGVVAAALNRVNHQRKGIKLSHPGGLDADGDLPIWASIDLLATSPEAIDSEVLDRYLGMIRLGLKALADELLLKVGDAMMRH